MVGQDTPHDRDLYPFASHWLDLDGVRYHYLDEGPADAPPVLMLHGNPTWSFYYRTLIPAISRDHRVIVPDHVGCGLSDKPQEYDYCLEQHIRNVERLAAALDLRQITLVMHDWGGAIGMGYATRHPEHVARFVVLNTAAFYQPVIPLRIRACRIPVLGDLVVRGLNAFARLALPMATWHGERMTRAVRAGYLAPYDSWRNRIAILRFVQDIPLEARHRTRRTLAQIEDNLYLFSDHPMLIVWGARDFCFTARDFLPEWQARFPYAEVHVVADAGHYVVEDAHERIVPWMRAFLDGARSAGTTY
ncbi:MAG: alpha/beta fold hydrolase [Anaerolineae bacterium]|nr:alpha/beta fold hydrolase [Anaerolineae bacterium]